MCPRSRRSDRSLPTPRLPVHGLAPHTKSKFSRLPIAKFTDSSSRPVDTASVPDSDDDFSTSISDLLLDVSTDTADHDLGFFDRQV